MDFTTSPATILHLDINSCFATIEQQANPRLRDKTIAVSASPGRSGCILAASQLSKQAGVKTGMRVWEAKSLCPSLIVLPPDPDKYRHVHQEIRRIVDCYSDNVCPKSIDEFVIDLHQVSPQGLTLRAIVQEIKTRIKSEVGEFITVSIGIAPNRILAKLGSDIDKPDGLQVIDASNYMDVYRRLELTDFCGISTATKGRLNRAGIVTVIEFYEASEQRLRSAFGGIIGRDWYYHLRGYNYIKSTKRSVFGNSYVLPTPMTHKGAESILVKLVDKSARRLRLAGYETSIIGLYIRYSDHTSYHKTLNLGGPHFDTRDLVSAYLKLYREAPHGLVKHLAESCSGLSKATSHPTLFGDTERARSLMTSLDQVNDKYGAFTLRFGSESPSTEHVHDTIAFGK